MQWFRRQLRSGPRRARTAPRVALAVGLLAASGALALVGPATASAAVGNPLVSEASGRCLDVQGNDQTPGTAVAIWDCNGQQNQGWVFTGSGELRTFDESRCLDVPGRSTTAGTALIIWTCNGQSNQQFRLNSNGTITAVESNLCLDVEGNGTANGTSVVTWSCNGQANQRWNHSGGPITPPPSGSCDVAPVDPNATEAARDLLCYLYELSGNHILSGQQESTWVAGPDYEINYIHGHTGRYPAIRGLDMGDSPDFGSRALAWWNAGGIPSVSYHMGSPAQSQDGYNGSRMSADINAALTPGTADHNRFIQRLDAAAAQLQIVENGGGAVLWRPFHEAGGTWFWWSMEGGNQYNRLWRFIFEYYTQTKGLHNLVWLHPYNGDPQASFYPGKAYVDVGGADTYAGNHGPLTGLFNETRNIVGSTIPIALHENGPIPDPSQLQSSGTDWVAFNTWHTSWITDTSINPVWLLQDVYSSSYVITRDEVPDLG